jgi:cobalt-zinc-cadmium efflux system membrane fusion protein
LTTTARVAFRDGATSSVSAPVEGRVAEILVQAGDRVAAGDALVVLSSPAAAAARAAQQRATVGERVAREAVGRQQRLMEHGVGVLAELRAAEGRLAAAVAALDDAQKQVAFLGPGDGTRAVVTAPIAGTVLQRGTTVGALVGPESGAVMELGDPDALWVVADVHERDLSLVQTGAPVRIELASQSGPLAGRVVAVGAALRDDVRTAPVYVAVEPNGSVLRAGMHARAQIEVPAPDGLLLPTAAVLVKDGQRTIVYVESGEGFEPRAVTIGHVTSGHVPVLSGLQAGERVVVRGALLLDGAADQLL